jgi:signal transduction histidine kinase
LAAAAVEENVRADPERIVHVLRNLLSNAAKYWSERSQIRVGAVRARDRVRSEVVDNGPGMLSQDLAGIFEKFGRGSDQRSRRGGGAGIGLYLSRRIVRAHGGELTVCSTPGQGSTFAFELAVAK